jgi:hypothetical protein
MDKVQEFQRRATECRALAGQGGSAEIRAHYENLAAMWDKLAEERLAFGFTVESPAKPALAGAQGQAPA